MPVNIGVLNSTTGFGGLCLQFTRLVLGAPALYATAYKAYLGAKFKHPGDTNPPYGVPVFWAPKHPGEAGHVAPSLGNGLVRTTNSATQTIYTVAISKITSAWGMPYLGWTEDLNNTRIWTPPAPAQEDDMPTAQEVAQAVWTMALGPTGATPAGPAWTHLIAAREAAAGAAAAVGPLETADPHLGPAPLATFVGDTRTDVMRLLDIAHGQTAQIAALPAAVIAALPPDAASAGVSLTQVEAAVKSALATLQLKSV